jgi:hypothetical protein
MILPKLIEIAADCIISSSLPLPTHLFDWACKVYRKIPSAGLAILPKAKDIPVGMSFYVRDKRLL